MVFFKDKNGLEVKASLESDNTIDPNFFLIKMDDVWKGLKFQTGNPKEVGINGYTNESMAAILIQRLKIQDQIVPSDQNKTAIAHLEAVLEALNLRVQDRVERLVEGTQAA